MKGLILKDVYCVRYQIIGGLLIMLLPSILLLLAGGGMFAAEDEAQGVQAMMLNITGTFTYGLVNYISITVCSSFLLNTIGTDEKSGWAKMQRAMPVSGGQIIGSKMLTTCLILVAMTLISLFLNILGALVFGIPLEPMITVPLCVCMMQMITLLPTYVLSYKFGSKVTTVVYICAVILVAAAAIVLLIALLVNDITIATMRIVAYAVLPAAAAATVIICYLTGKRAVAVDI